MRKLLFTGLMFLFTACATASLLPALPQSAELIGTRPVMRCPNSFEKVVVAEVYDTNKNTNAAYFKLYIAEQNKKPVQVGVAILDDAGNGKLYDMAGNSTDLTQENAEKFVVKVCGDAKA